MIVLFEGGSLTIYTSKNLKDWEKHGSVQGFHECPELFPLAIDGDPKHVRWIMYGGERPVPYRDVRWQAVCPGNPGQAADVPRGQVLCSPDVQQHRRRHGGPAAANPGGVARRAGRAALDPHGVDASDNAAGPFQPLGYRWSDLAADFLPLPSLAGK